MKVSECGKKKLVLDWWKINLHRGVKGGVLISSIVYEVVKTISKDFLGKVFRARHKQKQTISILLEVFACEKLLPLLFFVRLILFFSFVSACGVREKFFLKKF